MEQGAKERILKAAEELFFTKGYEATGIREIALKAGVNSAMINYYFKSKEGLYRALLFSHLDTLEQKVKAIEASDEMDFLKKFVRIHIETLRLRGPRVAVMMMRELHAQSDVGRDIMERVLKVMGERVLEVISSAVKKGMIRKLPERLILGFLIHIDAMLAIRFADIGVDEAVDLALSLFLKGVGA